MKRRSLSSLATVALVGLVTQPLQAHATDVEQASFKLVNGLGVLSVEAPRPVDLAARTLAAQYHAVITYEDPQYQDADDTVDRAASVRKDYGLYAPGKAPKALGPVGGTLSVNFSSSDLKSMLDQLNQAQTTAKVGGRFGVETTGAVYHIVPVQVRDSSGKWIKQQSILDKPISLDSRPRGSYELLSSICGAVAGANNRGVLLITASGPDTDQSPRYTLAASQESARSVLVRALAMMAPDVGQLTWSLYYDVGSGKYYMNFLRAPVVVSATTATPSHAPAASQPAVNGAAIPAH